MDIITGTQRQYHKPTSMTEVSKLLGDNFGWLLMELPDEFFDLLSEERIAGWDRILEAIHQGTNDPYELAKLSLKQEAN